MFTIHVLHSICKACDNLRMRGRTSKSAGNILNDVRTTTLGIFTLTFAWNRDCRLKFRLRVVSSFPLGDRRESNRAREKWGEDKKTFRALCSIFDDLLEEKRRLLAV